MISQRFLNHLKQQHWTGVFIELVIVVLGVFLGLQAQDWNQARQDRIRELSYLTRIAAELDTSISSIKHAIDTEKQRQAYGELLIRSVKDVDLVKANPGRFIAALMQAGWTYSPAIGDATFQEMKSAGDLGLVGNAGLRSEIVSFYSFVNEGEQWNYSRQLDQTEYTKRGAGILTLGERQAVMNAFENSVDNAGVPKVSVDEALEARKRMLARPAFIDWLPQSTDREDRTMTDSIELHRAERLRQHICASPGVSCADPDAAGSGSAPAPKKK